MNEIKIKGYQLLEITKKLTSSGSWFKQLKLNIYSRGKTIYKEYILDMFMQAMELSDCVSENFNYHSDKFICELPEFELEFQP